MTVDEFFKAVEKTGPYRLTQEVVDDDGLIDQRGDMIRLTAPEFSCPIEAVWGDPLTYWVAAARWLKLNARSAHAIAQAADNDVTTSSRRRYRNRLLEACGLREA